MARVPYYQRYPNVVVYDLVPTKSDRLSYYGYCVGYPTNPLTPANLRGGTMPNFGQVVLAEVPGQAATYQVTVALNVSLPTDKNGFPITSDWLLSIYSTGILDGLLGRMYSQPNKLL